MPDPVRLAKRLTALVGCSRNEAEQYIKGGWVTVDGAVVENPAHPVSTETVALDPAARLEAVEPATILLHKPPGYDTISGPRPAADLVQPDTHWPDDPSGVRLLQRHFNRLTPLVPLDAEASGLMVLTQDGRVWRRLTEDRDDIEQEFIVEVSGDIAPWGLARLNHGLHYGQLAERDPAALCAQGRPGRAAARRVRAGRPGGGGDPAHPHRQDPAGEDARGQLALPARRRALLRPAALSAASPRA